MYAFQSPYASPFVYSCVLDTALLGPPFVPGASVYFQVAASAAIAASAVLSAPSHPGVGKAGVLVALLGGELDAAVSRLHMMSNHSLVGLRTSSLCATDLGTTSNSENTYAHILANPENFSALVHVGDLSYADGDQPVWDTYGGLFSATQLQPRTIPWMTGIGNHGSCADRRSLRVLIDRPLHSPQSGLIRHGARETFSQ